MSIEEFLAMPEEEGEIYDELHEGELVELRRPKFGHVVVQHVLQELLSGALGSLGFVVVRFPFRAVPLTDYRYADVAFVGAERWRKAAPDDNLHGAPELVAEVLSPSDTEAELCRQQALCLATGALQFWEVDPKTRQIVVARRDGTGTTYSVGSSISLADFGGGEMAVEAVFADPRR